MPLCNTHTHIFCAYFSLFIYLPEWWSKCVTFLIIHFGSAIFGTHNNQPTHAQHRSLFDFIISLYFKKIRTFFCCCHSLLAEFCFISFFLGFHCVHECELWAYGQFNSHCDLICINVIYVCDFKTGMNVRILFFFLSIRSFDLLNIVYIWALNVNHTKIHNDRKSTIIRY